MPITDYLSPEDETMILTEIGDDGIVYNGVTIPGIVSYGTQDIVMQEAFSVSPSITLTTLKKDVPKMQRGSKFTHGTRKLVVDQLLQDTETHTTWTCRDANKC